MEPMTEAQLNEAIFTLRRFPRHRGSFDYHPQWTRDWPSAGQLLMELVESGLEPAVEYNKGTANLYLDEQEIPCFTAPYDDPAVALQAACLVIAQGWADSRSQGLV